MSKYLRVWFIMFTLVLIFNFDSHAAVYEPISIERMIVKSDLIVVGTVTDTYIKVTGRHDRYSTIEVSEIVKSDQIVKFHQEKSPDR